MASYSQSHHMWFPAKSKQDQRRSSMPKVCQVKTIFSAISQNQELLLWFTNPYFVCLHASVWVIILRVWVSAGSDMFSIASYFLGILFLVTYSISHFKKHIYCYKARLELMLTYFFFLDYCIFPSICSLDHESPVLLLRKKEECLYWPTSLPFVQCHLSPKYMCSDQHCLYLQGPSFELVWHFLLHFWSPWSKH